MFKSIALAYGSDTDDITNIEIEDTDFNVVVPVSAKYREWGCCIRREVAIITEYSKRGLPVAPCLARAYLTYSPHEPLIKVMLRDKEMFDEVASELEYSAKYYPCVVRQIKQLHFGRKMPL